MTETEHSDAYHTPQAKPVWWKTPSGLVGMFFFAAAGYVLLTEHTAHVVSYLPWLIILLCPLMHIFHHRGHGNGGHGAQGDGGAPNEGGRDA